MNSERRKSIIVLGLTLLFGVMLGLLVPGFFHKLDDRGKRPPRTMQDNDPDHKRKWYVGTVNRIVKPDSMQAKQMKPITDWAAMRIDSIERSANLQMSNLLDSVRSQLKPIITEEQLQRLQDFDAKAKANWRGGERRGGGRPE